MGVKGQCIAYTEKLVQTFQVTMAVPQFDFTKIWALYTPGIFQSPPLLSYAYTNEFFQSVNTLDTLTHNVLDVSRLSDIPEASLLRGQRLVRPADGMYSMQHINCWDMPPPFSFFSEAISLIFPLLNIWKSILLLLFSDIGVRARGVE